VDRVGPKPRKCYAEGVTETRSASQGLNRGREFVLVTRPMGKEEKRSLFHTDAGGFFLFFFFWCLEAEWSLKLLKSTQDKRGLFINKQKKMERASEAPRMRKMESLRT